jgi:hypothetical protein
MREQWVCVCMHVTETGHGLKGWWDGRGDAGFSSIHGIVAGRAACRHKCRNESGRVGSGHIVIVGCRGHDGRVMRVEA